MNQQERQADHLAHLAACIDEVRAVRDRLGAWPQFNGFDLAHQANVLLMEAHTKLRALAVPGGDK